MKKMFISKIILNSTRGSNFDDSKNNLIKYQDFLLEFINRINEDWKQKVEDKEKQLKEQK